MKLPTEAPAGGLELGVPGGVPPPPEPKPAKPTLWSMYGPTPQRSGLMIEPDYLAPYHAYMTNRSPETADAMLKALSPVIDESLRSYGGTEAATVTARARAKKMVLEAVDRYSPERAKLRTHLLSHLRGLRRVTERSTAGVYVPEQWRLDARHVDAATSDLSDALGRDPSDAEVADRLGLPLDRVRKARSVPGVLAGSQYEGPSAGTAPADEKAWNTWVESVYADLNPIDQVILEHSFGLHGRPALPANRIAAKVNLSAGAVSQRKSRIQMLLDGYDSFMGRR